jgi:hypothetical protein
MILFSSCTRSAISRHGRPNAIAKQEADDHADHKLHFPYPAWPKERLGDGDQPAQTTAFLGVFGERGPMVFWPGFSVAAFKKDKRF